MSKKQKLQLILDLSFGENTVSVDFNFLTDSYTLVIPKNLIITRKTISNLLGIPYNNIITIDKGAALNISSKNLKINNYYCISPMELCRLISSKLEGTSCVYTVRYDFHEKVFIVNTPLKENIFIPLLYPLVDEDGLEYRFEDDNYIISPISFTWLHLPVKVEKSSIQLIGKYND